MPDDEVLSGSVSRDRVLITSDKDFGDLVFRDGKTAVGVVLIRFDIVTAVLADDPPSGFWLWTTRGAASLLCLNAEPFAFARCLDS